MKQRLYAELHPWFDLRPWKRHGLVLMVSGLVYIFVGVSFMLSKPTEGRQLALSLALKWMPMPSWGVVFIFAGLLAILSSRWPPISKTWGYMVLTGLSAGWGTFYTMGVIFFDAPIQNLSQTAMWGLIAFLWWAISGLLNPNDVRLKLYEIPLPEPTPSTQLDSTD